MLIDKFRGLIRSDFDRKKILMYSLPIVSFIIGLLVPSPLFDRLREATSEEEEQQLVEVTGLMLADVAVMTAPLSKAPKQGRDMAD